MNVSAIVDEWKMLKIGLGQPVTRTNTAIPMERPHVKGLHSMHIFHKYHQDQI